MTIQTIQRILEETAYVRTGGSKEELACAQYLQEQCRLLGATAVLEPFEVEMASLTEAALFADGTELPCTGYLCAGSSEVEAPLYYLRNTDAASLSQCRGKIVLLDGMLRYWTYQDLLEHGALGFITYTGDASYADEDIDVKELRSYISNGKKLPGVNINAKQAISLIKNGVSTVKIRLRQDEYKGTSQNVVLTLPGELEETIVLTAHYDSTFLSKGAYDNMSGCIGLLALAEQFLHLPHRHTLRFIWCGSEERGLLGSKAYVAAHEDELKRFVLDINLDMIGSLMGRFVACCSSEEKLGHYIEYLALEKGFGIKVSCDIYSSDSTPFADKGVPAVSFARFAPNNTATIHNRYDTSEVLDAARLKADIDFLFLFTEHMANACVCPVGREIPDSIKEKLDVYLFRKRKE